MRILYILARSDSVCAFDFRCRHAACSLAERAFWECVKRVQCALCFSVTLSLTIILSQTQLREKDDCWKEDEKKDRDSSHDFDFFFLDANAQQLTYNLQSISAYHWCIVPLIIIIRQNIKKETEWQWAIILDCSLRNAISICMYVYMIVVIAWVKVNRS